MTARFMTDSEKTNNPQKPGQPKLDRWKMINLAMDLGFVIALPLVLFALAGKWLDGRVHNSTPWFTLLGIVLAITSTTIWLTKKLKGYIK